MALPFITRIKLAGGDVDIEVRGNIKALERQLKAFKVGLPRAYRNALNASATVAKNKAVGIVAKKHNIKPQRIKKMLKVAPRARATDLSVAVHGSSRRLNVYSWTASAVTENELGVRYNSGSGMKNHPHQFLATMPNGRTFIAVRATRQRTKRQYKTARTTGRRYLSHLPIRTLTYPGMGMMLTNKDVAEEVVGEFNKAMGVKYIEKLNDQVTKAKAAGRV